MDCLPSGYSFTQDDETKIQKEFFFCLICSCWNTSALMEKLKKKKKRENRKRKEKLSPVISQEEKSWDYP